MAAKGTVTVKILGDSKGLSKELGEAESNLGKFAGNAGKLVGAAALAGGAAVAGALAKGFFDALDAEAGVDRLQASLGLSDTDAQALGEAASAVYRDAWGDSLGQVQEVVGQVTSSFEGLGSDQVEDVTAKALAMSDAFGVDVTEAVQAASEMVTSGLAGSSEEAFDLLTVGLQKMPAGIREELLAASNEYGDFFNDLGISGEESFGLLTKFAEDGVYGIDKAGDALKELSIRGTDMSAASVVAYEAMGLSAEDMAASLLAGGDDARGAFDQIIGGLRGIEDPTEQAAAAVALFGTPIEDLSVSEIPGFLDSLGSMGEGFGDVEGAAANMADTLGDNTAAKIESFKREALGALADFAAEHLIPAFEKVATWFEANWPAIQATVQSFVVWFQSSALPVIQSVVSAIVTAVTAVVEWFQTNWPTIQATIASVVDWMQTYVVPVIEAVAGFIVTTFGEIKAWVDENWPAIQETIAGVIEAISIIIDTTTQIIAAIWETHGERIMSYISTVWESIKTIIDAAINIVRGVIDTVTSLISGDWDGVWNGIKTVLSGIWDAIESIVSTAVAAVALTISLALDGILLAWETIWGAVSSFVSDTWEDIKGFVSGGIEALVDFVTGIPGSIASAAEGAFDSIWTNFKGVINNVIDAWNGLSLPGFTIGGWDPPGPGPSFPSITIPSIGTPNIPRLASGGLAFAPMLAVIGDNRNARRDPEVVAPGSMIASIVRSELDRGRPGGMSGGRPLVIQLADHGTVRAMVDERDVDLLVALEAGVR